MDCSEVPTHQSHVVHHWIQSTKSLLLTTCIKIHFKIPRTLAKDHLIKMKFLKSPFRLWKTSFLSTHENGFWFLFKTKLKPRGLLSETNVRKPKTVVLLAVNPLILEILFMFTLFAQRYFLGKSKVYFLQNNWQLTLKKAE